MTKTIEDGQTEGLPQDSLTSVEIKERAEHSGVFCRAAATKRSVAHLKEGFGGIVSITGNSRLFKTNPGFGLCINTKKPNPKGFGLKRRLPTLPPK